MVVLIFLLLSAATGLEMGSGLWLADWSDAASRNTHTNHTHGSNHTSMGNTTTGGGGDREEDITVRLGIYATLGILISESYFYFKS